MAEAVSVNAHFTAKFSCCFLLLKADFFFFHSSLYVCGKHESVPIHANVPVRVSLTFLFLVCDERYSSCSEAAEKAQEMQDDRWEKLLFGRGGDERVSLCDQP